MRQMKYIIVEHEVYGEKPFIFSNLDQHNDIANLLLRGNEKVVGAGFVTFTPTGLQCWGESESLGIVSRHEEDSDAINRFWD